jgi:hypothetical protein
VICLSKCNSIGIGDIEGMKAVLKMTKSESLQRPGSISSEQADESARSDAILALGRKLVDELGLEPSVDTLGRWMAHYIADLIAKAESAPSEEKQVAEDKCFEAILALWKHRAELPNGKRPFENLEPVVRAIESLDPENDIARYFRSVRSPRAEGEEKTEVDRWLDRATSLDHSARILIGYYLAEAARAAVDKSEEWVKLAEAANIENGAPELVIRFVSSNAEFGNDPANGEIRRHLQDRIERLKGFIKLAETVAGDLTTRLEALSAVKQADDSVSEEPSG